MNAPKNVIIGGAGLIGANLAHRLLAQGETVRIFDNLARAGADQYVLDYARSFGLSTVVFRMSCIYGPRQFGTEDQGWLAHFLLRAIEGKPLVIYGDGLQVRDVLFVGDLVDAFLAARAQVPHVAGRPYNIGGGPENTTSLVELLATIKELFGYSPQLSYERARTGDQKYYVSDVRRFGGATGWTPRTKVRDGLVKLHAWLTSMQPRALAPTAAFAESRP